MFLLAAAVSPSTQAMNILLCNDDGITAANIRALKARLVAAGHSVVIAGPIDNQSGRGGYINFLAPIEKLRGTERGAMALGLPKDAAGIGTDPLDEDVHYVNSTPVAACLYGIDVVAGKKWQVAPDLVISGPNEGNNTGLINASSGTFNNLLYAINRNLPAIAVSDYASTPVCWSSNLPATHRSYEVADIVLRLVTALADKRDFAGGLLMPLGVGINVNVPDFAEGAGVHQQFKFTKIGKATAHPPAFYAKFSDSPVAVGYGLDLPVPGVSLTESGSTTPGGSFIPEDDALTSEQNVLNARGFVTLSPIEGAPQARPFLEDALRLKLKAIAQ